MLSIKRLPRKERMIRFNQTAASFPAFSCSAVGKVRRGRCRLGNGHRPKPQASDGPILNLAHPSDDFAAVESCKVWPGLRILLRQHPLDFHELEPR